MNNITVEEILNIKDKDKQLNERIEYINTHNLLDIPGRILPDVYTEDYFFISYCHADYRLVYKDIFLLQSHGLNIWYDKEMTVGDSWKDTANKYMVPRNCLGVLFYVSEDSLKSEPVIEELEFAKKTNKQFIGISLPFVSDLKHNGESVKGKIFLPFEMIDILLENGVIDEEKANALHEYFPNEKIYIKYDKDIFDKAKLIKDTLKKVPLFRKNRYDVITSISDTNVSKITKDDFAGIVYRFAIGKCAFANCAFLESFESDKDCEIREYAFFADKMLKSFNVRWIADDEVGAHAFEDCVSLDSFSDHELKYVGERAFANCEKLETIHLGKDPKIEKEAFANCKSLKQVIQPPAPEIEVDDLKYKRDFGPIKEKEIRNAESRIEEGAFSGCESLEEFDFPVLATSVKKDTFKGCRNLKKITIHHNVDSIASSAFLLCNSLSKIELKYNNYFIVKDGALFERKLRTLFRVIATDQNQFYVPRETRTIDKFAIPHFDKKIYIGVETGSEYFQIYRGGLMDKDKKFLFYLNETKNGIAAMSDVNVIQPFSLDNFSDLEKICIYKNNHEIADYAFTNFKNLKTIELCSNDVKLNNNSFNYKDELDTLIVKTDRLDLTEFKRFGFIRRVELHTDVTLVSSAGVKIGELVVLCKNVKVEHFGGFARLIIGKYYQYSEENKKIFDLLNTLYQCTVDKENKYYMVTDGHLFIK